MFLFRNINEQFLEPALRTGTTKIIMQEHWILLSCQSSKLCDIHLMFQESRRSLWSVLYLRFNCILTLALTFPRAPYHLCLHELNATKKNGMAGMTGLSFLEKFWKSKPLKNRLKHADSIKVF